MKLFKYTLVGIIILTSGLLFSFTIPQTPQVQAQSTFNALVGGAAEGLAKCATQFIGNEIFSGISNKISSTVEDKLKIGTSVPVHDSGTKSQVKESSTAREARESCMDGIAYAAAQNMLDQLADSTLGWVESGFTEFGQSGNPAYIGNLEDFVANVGEQTFNQFVEEYSNTNPSGVCNFFSDSVLLSVTNDYLANNRSPSGLQPSGVLNNFNSGNSNGCELESALGEEASKAFLEGDFSAGGWQAFLHTSQNPNANPIGAYLSQKSELDSRIRQARELNLQELENNSGWLSEIACPGNAQSLDSTTGQCRNPDGSLSEPVIKTPGTVVNETVNNIIGSDFRRLELADEINEIVTALGSMLVANLTGSGGDNYSGGFFGSDLSNRTSALSNINDYNQGNYNGPISEEFIARRTADQIELEEEILSIINQLPTRYELRQLEARLNQCLVNRDGFSAQFENRFGVDAESVLQGLFTVHSNVFPGGNTGGEREVGPQTINWVGNDFDWTGGKAYGGDTCGEGGLIIFQSSYVADTISGEWKAFMCLPNDDDNLVFKNITDKPWIFSDLIKTQALENTLIFQNRSLYRSPRNDRVKIDWDGGDFVWEHHNMLDKELPIILTYILKSVVPHTPISKILQILNSSTGADTNRYKSDLCDNRTEGQLSYIVRPNDDKWTQQECSKSKSESFYFFNDTGETFPAFRMLSDLPDTISKYATDIETLLGDETYDNSYEEPIGGDDLRELLIDVQTILAGNPTSAELSARKEAIDARFSRLSTRFHSQADLRAAREALRLFTETEDSPDYNYPQLLQYANANNCTAPDDWNSPTSSNGGSSGGGGSGSGGSSGSSGGGISDLYYETYGPNYTPEVPQYEEPEEINTSPGSVQVGVIFLGFNWYITERTRIWLNNTEYDFRKWGDGSDSRWDFGVIEHPGDDKARGELIELGEELHRVYIPKVDLWMEGTNNHGYGNAMYKVVAKTDDFDFNQITQDSNSDQFLSAAKLPAGGLIITRHGTTADGPIPKPNPDFNSYTLPQSMREGTVKFLIVISPARGDRSGYPNDWHPKP